MTGKKPPLTEKELRAAWTARGVSKSAQDAMIAAATETTPPVHDYGPTIGRGRNAVPTNPHPNSPMGRALAKAKLATETPQLATETPKPKIEMTPAGAQCVIPGAERASDKTLAQRKADAPLRPKAYQRPCDAGLFGDTKNQTSLF